jgi:iron complex outermembrane receptor protein
LNGAASAQTAPAPVPATEPATPQRVEITGGRGSDTEQRRQSTAAKIVIGRDEIERMGDSTVGEILKRLPGVTVQGAPGRGGNIRMRGLGSGYTQILLDGQRVPPGFSLDSLNPEQIERIEVLRAPTAETGARAIAGTINIVTREGFNRRLNDLRIGSAYENGRLQPGLSWTRNGGSGPFAFNLSVSGFEQDHLNQSVTTTTDIDAGGLPTYTQRDSGTSHDRRKGLHLSSRLQWKLDDEGDALVLSPFLVRSFGDSHRDGRIEASGTPSPDTEVYDHARSDGSSSFSMARLNGQWRQRLAGGTRLELQGSLGDSRSRSHTLRQELDAADGVLRRFDDSTGSHDRSASLNLKASRLLDNDHSLVAGAEAEAGRRTETSQQAWDGAPLADDLGDNLEARSTRLALYAQDEWNVNPHWAAHAGLRWEGIRTEGEAQGGPLQRNRSSVWSPLLHAVWKPDPKGRDQVRISLTRSYRSPSLGSLIGQPRRSPDNSLTRPDRGGNPELKPELATGLDVALERYLGAGGVLSANVFYRRLQDYIRVVTAAETVGTETRYVSRPRNIGDADTAGVELEAKFRLTEVWSDAPAVDVRSNLSVFRSRVKAVPGPDNRLDQQPGGTANLGADYRWRGTPLTIGGNLNWTPGYATRLLENQWAFTGRKRVVDAYALWTFSPAAQLRLSASNLGPLDYATGTRVLNLQTGATEAAETVARSYVNWQLRLEMKL